jgi:uncharacterized protein
MILYLDTSALVKRYVKETFSDLVITLWNGAEEIVTSSVAYAETMASFFKKKRECGSGDGVIKEALDSFQKEWLGFIRVEVNDGLNGHIRKVVEKHPLRGFDAIHLASALLIQERLPGEFTFACFDNRLLEAAEKEGLMVFPSESGGS